MITARRYGGDDAARPGIVDAAAGGRRGLARRRARRRAGGQGGATLGTIKSRMYARELEALHDRRGNRLLPPS